MEDLQDFLKGKKCQIYEAPFDVILPIANKKRNTATTIVQPDICVICDLSKLDDYGCVGAPDLIIEILSKSTTKKDELIKYKLYEENGVKEYWIVDMENKTVKTYLLTDDRYQIMAVYDEESETIHSNIFTDLVINYKKVFDEI